MIQIRIVQTTVLDEGATARSLEPAAKDWWKALGKKQRSAIRRYTGFHGRRLNRMLNDEISTSRRMKRLHSTLSGALAEPPLLPVTAYRGEQHHKQFTAATTLDEVLTVARALFPIGSVHHRAGYTSWSVARTVAARFGSPDLRKRPPLLFQATGVSGHYLGHINWAQEWDIIVAPGASFTVVDVAAADYDQQQFVWRRKQRPTRQCVIVTVTL